MLVLAHDFGGAPSKLAARACLGSSRVVGVNGRMRTSSRRRFTPASLTPLRSSAIAVIGCFFGSALSLRMVEEMLACPRHLVDAETIPQWGLKFAGLQPTASVGEPSPFEQNMVHLDAVVSASPEEHWLWRAVDQDGSSRILVKRAVAQRPPDACSQAPQKQGRPFCVLVTERGGYAAAQAEIMARVVEHGSTGPNNRVETPINPTRRRADHEGGQVAAARSTLPFRS